MLHVSGAEILHATFPRASVFVLPGISYLPMLESPSLVAGDYLAFGARLTP